MNYLAFLFKRLINIGQITLIPQKHLQPYPQWYKPKQKHEHHTSVVRDNIDSCFTFRSKLVQLIKASWITFDNTPYVNTNPLPNHTTNNENINVIISDSDDGNKEETLKVTISRLFEMLSIVNYHHQRHRSCWTLKNIIIPL